MFQIKQNNFVIFEKRTLLDYPKKFRAMTVYFIS